MELGLRGTAVGHCFGKQFRPLEAIPQDLGQGIKRPVLPYVPVPIRHRPRDPAPYLMLWKIREKRVADGHFQTSQNRAPPLVEKNKISARPTRFSTGI